MARKLAASASRVVRGTNSEHELTPDKLRSYAWTLTDDRQIVTASGERVGGFFQMEQAEIDSKRHVYFAGRIPGEGDEIVGINGLVSLYHLEQFAEGIVQLIAEARRLKLVDH